MHSIGSRAQPATEMEAEVEAKAEAEPSSHCFKQFRVLVLVVALSGIRHFIMPPRTFKGADLRPQYRVQSADSESESEREILELVAPFRSLPHANCRAEIVVCLA